MSIQALFSIPCNAGFVCFPRALPATKIKYGIVKPLALLAAFFCSATFLGAQEEHPVIVLATEGKVAYQSSDSSEAQNIATGAVLKLQGSIILNKKEHATLFCNGQFRQVEGDQTIALKTIFPESDGLVPMNFDASFGDYVMAAVSMAASPENTTDSWTALRTTKGTGDGWSSIKTKGTGDGFASIKIKGTGDGRSEINATAPATQPFRTTKATGDGWGGKGTGIHAIMPYGKVRSGKKVFQWSKPEGNPLFKLEIKNSEGAVVLDTLAQDTFLVLESAAEPFKQGARYEWRVTVSDDSTTASDAMFFEIGDPAAEQEALQSAEKAPLFQESTEEVRNLMRAVALERGGWYEESSKLYLNLQKSESKNNMIRLMHAAFWMRQGLKPLAESVFSGK